MDPEKIKLRIKQKSEAIVHFEKHLKDHKEKKVKPTTKRPDLNTEKGMAKWYKTNITALENKIAYEKDDLKNYQEKLKEA